MLYTDPLGQPKVTAGRDNCFFRTCCPSVRPSIRPHFSNLEKQLKPLRTMFATGVTMGLAEWITEDTCLVVFSTRTSVACDVFHKY